MQIPPDPSSPWIIVFTAAMWLGVTGLLATLSGWTSLATQWRAQEDPKGERFSLRSGSIGVRFLAVPYRNCLTITISDRGLGLSQLFLLRFLSPPLFIPWAQVASVNGGRFLLFRHVVVQPANHWSRITLYGTVAEKVLEASIGRIRSAAYPLVQADRRERL
jgi:hypothetical protein